MIIAIWIIVAIVVVLLILTRVVTIIRFQEIESKFHEIDVDLHNLSESNMLNHKDITALTRKVNQVETK